MAKFRRSRSNHEDDDDDDVPNEREAASCWNAEGKDAFKKFTCRDRWARVLALLPMSVHVQALLQTLQAAIMAGACRLRPTGRIMVAISIQMKC